MPLTIELPSPLDEELTQEAEREGISAEEHAALLVVLATALLKEDKPTPFQEMVREYLSHRALDADHVASVFEELVQVCLAVPHGKGKTEAAFQFASRQTPAPGNHDIDLALFRQWRSAPMHTLLQKAGRLNRQVEESHEEITGKQADDENAASIALLQSWLKEEATDDPEKIRKAEEELEEFKRNLNANRAATGERLLFP